MFTSCNFTSKILTLIKCTNFIHISLVLFVLTWICVCIFSSVQYYETDVLPTALRRQLVQYYHICKFVYWLLTTVKMKNRLPQGSLMLLFSNHEHLPPTPSPTFNPWQPLISSSFLKFYYIKNVMYSSYKFCKKLQR